MSNDFNDVESNSRGEPIPGGTPVESAETSTGPAGAFVVLVGPDGVGKTTLARTLLEARRGRYFHFRPPFRNTRMPRKPPHQEPARSKDPGSVIALAGWLRLARSVVNSWVGYLTAIRPTTASGDLVVGDRWLYGYLVQPRPLRYKGPGWLARFAIALLPAPDLVVNLGAPVDLIRARKGELSREDILMELDAWRHIPVANLVTVDMSGELEDVTRAVLQHLP